MMKILPFMLFLLYSCADSSNGRTQNQPTNGYSRSSHSSYSDENEESDEDNSESGIEDGTHSATVRYYNPETGYMETYNLDVEVEDGEVHQINFPKGGWLDESHISPEELEDGEATLRDEEGRKYKVEIDDN